MEENGSVRGTRYPLSERAETLTEQFYEWDGRLRGYELWTYPVALEPTFQLCPRWVTPREAIADDTQKHTLLSGLVERVKRMFAGGNADFDEADQIEEISNEFDPYLYVPEGEILEFQVALPTDTEYSRSVVSQFINSLIGTRHPLSFEIIGASTQVVMQLSCRHRDADIVASQLDAFFPDAVIRQERRYLEQLWGNLDDMPMWAVDFGLARECAVPLDTPTRFNPDPLTSVVAAMSACETGEIQILQVMFQPVVNNWAREIMGSVVDFDGSPFFADAPELVGFAREKSECRLFGAVIRTCAKGQTEERAVSLLQRLGGALSQFNARGQNDLIPLNNDGYPQEIHVSDILDRLTHRSGMLLNLNELVGFVHFPMKSVSSKKLLRAVGRTKEAPRISLGHKLKLGENIHRGHSRSVTLSLEQRMRHTYVIGASGTGKSTLLLNMLIQDIEAGRGIALLDPHGDLVDEVIRRVPEERIDDVILLDPSDDEFPIGFNIFDAHSEAEKILLASDLAHVFRRLSTSWGDQMNAILANGIIAMLEHRDDATLVTLRRFLVEADYRRKFLEGVDDSEIKYYWNKEYPLLSGRPQAPVLTRLDTFLRSKLIRNMVAQKKNAIDFSSVMNNRKILLAKLSHGGIGAENAFLLGTLVVTALYQAAQRRQAIPRDERTPFFIYIDEFQNFITPSMESILSGARKYSVALILAHQDLQQLSSRDRDVASSVLSNPYTRICFRLGDADARLLARGLSYFEANDLQSLGIGEAITRIEQAQYDFNLGTSMPPELPIESETIQARIVETSRARYGKKREIVEQSLADMQADEIAQPSSKATYADEAVESTQPSNGRRKKGPNKARSKSETKSSEHPGRGGAQHTYLQSLIQKIATERGFKASVEESVLGGAGAVDVALTCGETKIACEITMTTSVRHELDNINKCIAAGFDYIVLLSHERRKLNLVRNLAREHLDTASFEKIRFLVPDEFIAFLDEPQAKTLQKSKRVRGYKVKVNYKAGSAEDQKVRRDAIAKLIVQSMKRMKP